MPFLVVTNNPIRNLKKKKKKKMMGLMSIQTAMDLMLAGFSLMIGFGFFALMASVLCSLAFFHHVTTDPAGDKIPNQSQSQSRGDKKFAV